MYTLVDLKSLRTLRTGQTCDLKIDTGKVRVWLCRCGIADGMPYDNQVTVEHYDQGAGWQTVDEYEAL